MHPFSSRLTPLFLLALSQMASAQQVPNAGTQIQQIPPAPVPPKAPPQFRVEQNPVAPSPVGGDTAVIKRLLITGNQAYTTTELLAVTGFVPGRALTLADLRAMADRIAEVYHQRGYFVAQAYLPAQDIRDGAVTIAVMEGQYGKIDLRNHSKLSDALLQRVAGGLSPGDTILVDPLERRLLLLSDLAGVTVKSTMVPGASVGASDLIVEVDPGRLVTGSVDADNEGSRYTGSRRVGATINLNNLAGLGDVASLRVMSSGSDLNYGRASYQVQAGAGNVGVAFADMRYILGKEFSSLHSSGSTRIASVYGSYSLVRARGGNLSVQLDFDDKSFHDRQNAGASPSKTDKRARVGMLSLLGDSRDAWWGGGSNNGSLVATQGHVLAPATTAHSTGAYSKFAWTVSRTQALSDNTVVYASFNGQLASKNLDSSEKMELGGANAVRAYPEGEAYGDQGHVGTVEGRLLLPSLAARLPGQWQLVGFFDAGSVTANKIALDAKSDRRMLKGAGLGLNWSGTGSLVKAYYARKVGAAPATSAPDAKGRFWIQAVKYF